MIVKNMKSFLVVVIDKTLYIHFEEYLDNARITITNNNGEKIYENKINKSFYEIIKLDQPSGKYKLKVDSQQIFLTKTIQI
jgi:hypothetical protein